MPAAFTGRELQDLGRAAAGDVQLAEAAAPAYMTDAEWDDAGEDWLEQALAYTAAPCKGVHGPITRIRARPIPPAVPAGRLLAVPGHDLVVLAGWAVAGLLAGLRFFRWAPQVPARSRRPAGFRARDAAV